MTMLSFRVSEEEASQVQHWAEVLGIDRSELLRDALGRHVAELAADADARSWLVAPLTNDEAALSEIGEWGPAEDWSDWDHA